MKQRYRCKECGKTFFDTKPKFSEELKKKVILMYLNLNTVVMIAFSEMKIPEKHTMTKRGLCAKVV